MARTASMMSAVGGSLDERDGLQERCRQVLETRIASARLTMESTLGGPSAVQLYGHCDSAQARFGVRGNELLTMIRKVYPYQKGQVVPWFQDGRRNVFRHPLFNNRRHDSVTLDYIDIMIDSGLIPGVGGNPWLTPSLLAAPGGESNEFSESSVGNPGAFWALAYGTRADAFYIAKKNFPNLPTILLTEAQGLQDVEVYGDQDKPLSPGRLQVFVHPPQPIPWWGRSQRAATD